MTTTMPRFSAFLLTFGLAMVSTTVACSDNGNVVGTEQDPLEPHSNDDTSSSNDPSGGADPTTTNTNDPSLASPPANNGSSSPNVGAGGNTSTDDNGTSEASAGGDSALMPPVNSPTGECPAAAPRADWQVTPMEGDEAEYECLSDADCQQEGQGYCEYGVILVPNFVGSECHYSVCQARSDCGSGSVCLCGVDAPNRCVAGNCTTDADCQGDLRCLRTHDVSPLADPCSTSSTYACQTPSDECATSENCDGNSVCGFDSQRHVCAPPPDRSQCPVP